MLDRSRRARGWRPWAARPGRRAAALSLALAIAGAGGCAGARAPAPPAPELEPLTTAAIDSADAVDRLLLEQSLTAERRTAWRFATRADSAEWESYWAPRRLPVPGERLRVVVTLAERRLRVFGRRGDTLLDAPVAVGMGSTLRFGKRAWTFATPRGTRTVLHREADPVWVPPDWFYAEVAAENGLKLVRIPEHEPLRLPDGRALVVRDSLVGLVGADSVFQPFPVELHVILGDTLFAPPLNTRNRHVRGELGPYALDLGDGYLLHGTPYQGSIGAATTHGCIRLRDADIAWLFSFVPVGTRVEIR